MPPNPDQELIATALGALRRVGISGKPLPPGIIRLQRGDQSVQLAAVVKPNLRDAHLATLREQRAASTEPIVVITDHVSGPLAGRLRDQGLMFLDTAGNAFLDVCGWYVFVAGNPLALPPPKHRPLSPSVWQVAYVLLREPRSQTQTVRALADHAGVSAGAAQTAIAALEARGWVRNLGRRGQPVTDALGLWRAWEHGYIDRLGPKRHLTQAVALGEGTALPLGPAGPLQQWLQPIEGHLGTGIGLLGGELAAQVLGADIIASTATLHVAQLDVATLRILRIVPAKEGPITVRQTFGDLHHSEDDPRLAHPLLVRAELLTIADERLDEARSLLARRIQQRLAPKGEP